MLRRRALAALVIAAAVALSVVSGLVHRDLAQTNGLLILFPIQLLALPVGAVGANRWLHARRELAPGLLAVGLYLLTIGGTLSTVGPIWLPGDNTILGSALLAGVWAGVGANLALASAAVLAGWPSTRGSVVSGSGGALAFLLVTISGMVSPLVRLQIPLLTIAALAIAALGIARHQRVRPVLLALVGGAGTLAVLLGRGPEDWASASTTLKLYSFPILLMAIGVSMALMDIDCLFASATRRSRGGPASSERSTPENRRAGGDTTCR